MTKLCIGQHIRAGNLIPELMLEHLKVYMLYVNLKRVGNMIREAYKERITP